MKKLVLITAAILLLAVACGTPERPTASPATNTPVDAVGVTADPSPASSEATVPPPTARATEPPTVASTDSESGEETSRPTRPFDQTIYDNLLSTDFSTVNNTVRQLGNSADLNNTAILLEMFRAAQIGLVELPPRNAVEALENLTGQTFGGDWPAWIEWYGATDLVPPAGFTGWKGRLLIPIDPRFADFLDEDLPADIRVEEIQWGGVVVDGIPALDNPAMIAADAADYLDPNDVVFGLAFNGDVRAYPLKIIDWHEMANDVVGGVPVSLAYCTLCGAAIAYDGRASNGETYDFGSSGFLFRSNKLMYDRQTRTLWNQLTGQPVLGELVGTGVELDILPVVLTTWSDWQAIHPETVVLDVDTGFSRPYETGAAYGDYFSSPGTMFPVWQRSNLLPDKSQVFALRVEGIPAAYPLDTIAAEQIVNDTIGQTDVVVIGSELLAVDGVSRRSGAAVTYSPGSTVRAFERGDRTFGQGATAEQLIDQDGQIWQLTEDALIGPDDQMLPRLGGHLAYWFGWFAFFPNTVVYGE